MSNTALFSLLNYLEGTLSHDDMLWLGIQLLEYTKHDNMVKPYTIEEINQMIDESERQAARGELRSNDDVFNDIYEEFAITRPEPSLVEVV